MNLLADFAPSDLGITHLEEFRAIQQEAAEQAVYGEERFQGLALPTGAGKSCVAVMIHKLTGWRCVILTATRGLQYQYEREWQSYGMIDIQGKANYRCGDIRNLNCADGMRAGCRLVKGQGCTYEDAKHKATNNNLLITNYAYWLHVNDQAAGLVRTAKQGRPNPFEVLILDECHSAPDELADYLAVRLYEKDLREILGITDFPHTDKLRELLLPADEHHRNAGMQYENMLQILSTKGSRATPKELEHAARLESLVSKLDRIKSIHPDSDEWICEYKEGNPKYGRSWEFDILWPGQYAEQYLFRGIPKVVLMSATLRPKHLGLLGIRNEDSKFTEWPRIFPADRNPIYYVPARRGNIAIQIKHKSPKADLELWIEQIDQIIEPRLDRKAIILPFSYERQKYIIEHSRFSKYMIGNTADPASDTATQICETFKSSPVSLILVSPSFGTGWDFPYKECEYIIIPKIPIVPRQSKIMQAREERDPRYPDHLAMQELVQNSGRGMRAVDDRCEVFIVDGSLGWFFQKNRSLAPKWFQQAIEQALCRPIEIPPVPEKLK